MASSDGERQPLLPTPKDTPTIGASLSSSTSMFVSRLMSRFSRPINTSRRISTGLDSDSTKYEAHTLNNWSSLLRLAGTVWQRRNMRVVVGYLFVLSFGVAMLVFFFVKAPDQLQVSKFAKLGTFLNVFVGLMLGFFLASSMNRWYACADGFLQIMDSIRNMQMQLLALGVPDDNIHDVLRYGILSVLMLELELQCEGLPDDEKPAHAEAMWKTFTLDVEEETPRGCHVAHWHMLPDEVDALTSIDDPAGVIWTWVALIIARLAQDGIIPGMASPTYGRIMGLAEDAHSGMRVVRSSISIQPAYIYVQLLASLVHFNNIINGIAFGLTWGATVGTAIMVLWPKAGKPAPSIGEVSRDAQNLILTFCISCLGPIIYQALLEVALTLAQPFSSPDGALPIGAQLHSLKSDLIHCREFSSRLPKRWKQPYFKQKNLDTVHGSAS